MSHCVRGLAFFSKTGWDLKILQRAPGLRHLLEIYLISKGFDRVSLTTSEVSRKKNRRFSASSLLGNISLLILKNNWPNVDNVTQSLDFSERLQWVLKGNWTFQLSKTWIGSCRFLMSVTQIETQRILSRLVLLYGYWNNTARCSNRETCWFIYQQ